MTSNATSGAGGRRDGDGGRGEEGAGHLVWRLGGHGAARPRSPVPDAHAGQQSGVTCPGQDPTPEPGKTRPPENVAWQRTLSRHTTPIPSYSKKLQRVTPALAGTSAWGVAVPGGWTCGCSGSWKTRGKLLEGTSPPPRTLGPRLAAESPLPLLIRSLFRELTQNYGFMYPSDHKRPLGNLLFGKLSE